MEKKKFLALIIYQIDSPPFIIDVPAELASNYSAYILDAMSKNKMCIFKSGEGDTAEIIGAIRGMVISSFLFRQIDEAGERESLETSKRIANLQLELLTLQVQEYRGKNSGDEWKNGY